MPSVSMPNDLMDERGLDNGGDPTKVLVRRYLAYLVDFLLIALIGILALAFTAQASTPEELGLQPNDVKRYQETDNGLYVVYFRDVPVLEDEVGILVVEPGDLQVIALVLAAAWILMYVGMQGFTGATVGKGAAGIRTVKGTGDPPGILRALVRSLLLPIDALPSTLLPLVGTIFAVATTGHRRLGDLVGRTYVVDKDAKGRPVELGGGIPPQQIDGPMDHLQPPADAPLAPVGMAAGTWDSEPAVAAVAPADPSAPPWAQGPAAAPAGELDWTSEQQAPSATTDPWAPAAGAGTSASDWENAIAAEQAEVEPVAPAVGGGATEASASTASIDDYEPQWDEGRGSYIQWDPRRDEWLQFSDELQEWHPIDRPPTT